MCFLKLEINKEGKKEENEDRKKVDDQDDLEKGK